MGPLIRCLSDTQPIFWDVDCGTQADKTGQTETASNLNFNLNGWPAVCLWQLGAAPVRQEIHAARWQRQGRRSCADRSLLLRKKKKNERTNRRVLTIAARNLRILTAWLPYPLTTLMTPNDDIVALFSSTPAGGKGKEEERQLVLSGHGTY